MCPTLSKKQKDNSCRCGSGYTRRELKDGYGIFLTFVCDACEDMKVSFYRSDIMSRYETDEQIEED